MPEITDAGLIAGMPDAVYHADPVPAGSLSASGAKLLLEKTPAHYRWTRDNGQPPKQEFDLGHAAHAEVLGDGPEVWVFPGARDWRTKAAQKFQADAYAEGAVPLLEHQYAAVRAMAAAIRAHPVAGRLFDPEYGRPEMSAFWPDETHGVWRRARFDWLRDPTLPGPYLIPDLKTGTSANPALLRKRAVDHGWHLKDAFYREAARVLLDQPEARLVFVAQENVPPYVVTCLTLDAEARVQGERDATLALEVYAECTAADVWPAYSDDVVPLSLPAWAITRDEEYYQ